MSRRSRQQSPNRSPIAVIITVEGPDANEFGCTYSQKHNASANGIRDYVGTGRGTFWEAYGICQEGEGVPSQTSPIVYLTFTAQETGTHRLRVPGQGHRVVGGRRR